MNELLAGLGAVLTRLEPALVELRRDIHAHPELAHHEHRTTALVTERLAAVGYHIHPLPDTGLVADLGPHEPTYRIALRADLDALPVADQTGLPWASKVDGVCHACGHDLHVAAVLGAGLAFAEFADELRRRDMAIRLVFQPAEEMIPGGAIDVVELG
ncbi:MAG TPA: M20/M25/M40 family metallo-hydrolase, partial [Candidatus Lustribacter sp.]|nr:M20/M25/M40 family metallo-hydrolase [Candidatus Lustribacter sp.]